MIFFNVDPVLEEDLLFSSLNDEPFTSLPPLIPLL
jgi:hypothetical protein